MGLSNDTRGWVMTVISGVACVLGALVICADLVVRLFPGKKDFRIQDSDAFLSASLSLSFGVMLFSALFKMLPSSLKSLQQGGMASKEAHLIMMACFLGGVAGIRAFSAVLHRYMTSHVVDCEHTHDEEEQKKHVHGHSHARQPSPSRSRFDNSESQSHGETWAAQHPSNSNGEFFTDASETTGSTREVERADTFATAKSSRPSLKTKLSRSLSRLTFPSREKRECGQNGPCYGFSEPCGQECFKIVQARGSFATTNSQKPKVSQRSRLPHFSGQHTESSPLLSEIRKSDSSTNGSPHPHSQTSDLQSDGDARPASEGDALLTPYDHAVLHRHQSSAISESSGSSTVPESPSQQHHHHVPVNKFMSIGLQTVIAIALHKLPEGFITFATNHANPRLGFSVFLALFIHNITEGFAMALPLYLALQSRWKAMFWSSLLGGFSQPLGAGIAALWFKVAGGTDYAPSERVYGGMFAVTAGIMTSVALQLFSESLDLTHNRGLCMVFAFVGMGIMGISSALTA